jgi:GT2 family glycosyltransferase
MTAAEIEKEPRENRAVSPSGTILISVVIVCYNSRQWLIKCFESLQKQTFFPQSEVILVDNASKDDTEQLARELTAGWPNAHIIQAGANVGFGAANNHGVEVSRGKYVYLLNPDTWLEPDCLEQFFVTAERENAGCAGGLILEYEDNTEQARGSIGFDFCGYAVPPYGNRIPKQLCYINGFFFIRKDLYVRVGELDEFFFMYGEELDLSWRVWISGEKIVPALAARVHHRGAVSVNPVGGSKIVENRTSPSKRFLANRNSLLFIAKNCQHLLLLMLLPCAAFIVLEGLFVWLMTRDAAIAKKISVDAFADFWRLRGHVFKQRKRIHSFRRRGDFWMLRFFRLGFGRSHEIRAILKRGFPKFNHL